MVAMGYADARLTGWSTGKVTLVYQHITGGVRRDAAGKVGSFIWGEDCTANDGVRGPTEQPRTRRPALIEHPRWTPVET